MHNGLLDYSTSKNMKVKLTWSSLRRDHEGLDGDYRYTYTLSLTSVLDGGWWWRSRPSRFTLGRDPLSIVYEAGWASGPILTGAENFALTETVLSAASHYIDQATAAH
jgi:hypothetical protein